MKRCFLFVVLSLVLLLVGCDKRGERPVKSDWQNDELVGRVHAYKIVNYLAGRELGEVVKGDVLGSVGRIVYNESGFRTDEYWLFNEEESHREYSYDEKGHCVGNVYRKSSGEVEERCESKYGADGVLAEDCYYRGDGGLLMRVEYSFDKEGNLVEQRQFDSEGVLEERHCFKYDSDGLEEEHLVYYYEGNNSMVVKQKNRYEKGLLAESKLFDDGDNVLGHWSYQYDEHRHVVAEESYDNRGDMAERQTYEYEYDEVGNWVKRVTYDGLENEPRVVSERQIEYYK